MNIPGDALNMLQRLVSQNHPTFRRFKFFFTVRNQIAKKFEDYFTLYGKIEDGYLYGCYNLPFAQINSEKDIAPIYNQYNSLLAYELPKFPDELYYMNTNVVLQVLGKREAITSNTIIIVQPINDVLYMYVKPTDETPRSIKELLFITLLSLDLQWNSDKGVLGPNSVGNILLGKGEAKNG